MDNLLVNAHKPPSCHPWWVRNTKKITLAKVYKLMYFKKSELVITNFIRGGFILRKIIIATHGELSKGLVNSISIIAGESFAEQIQTYSLYPGEDVSALAEKVKEEVLRDSSIDYVLLTDIMGGSVDNNLYHLITNPNVWLISGVNLLLVLEIILAAEETPTEQVLLRSVESAKDSINFRSKLIPECNEDDDL
jgi:PTS system mannose-specific IIA component